VSEFTLNYFNYFTEIEEHFQKARGTALFLLSPLDWALIETWKSAEIPLEAVLRGIDSAFEKWRAKRSRAQQVNALAFCAQAVMVEAQRLADATASGQPRPESPAESPFADDQIRQYLEANATAIRATGIAEFLPLADSLRQIITELPVAAADLEALEQRLSMLQQKLVAFARTIQTEEQALAARRDLDAYLKPYRGRMTAPQIAMLEAQFLERSTLDALRLPRLSLFYLR
jgi:hypothetical protein